MAGRVRSHGVLEKVHGGVLIGFLEVFREGVLGEVEVEVAVLVLVFSGFLEGNFSLLDFVVDVLDVCAFLAQPTVGSVDLLSAVGVDLVFYPEK